MTRRQAAAKRIAIQVIREMIVATLEEGVSPEECLRTLLVELRHAAELHGVSWEKIERG